MIYPPFCQETRMVDGDPCRALAVAMVYTNGKYVFVCGNHVRGYLQYIPLGKVQKRRSIARDNR